MNEHNGHPSSPRKGVAGNMAAFTHDMVTLAELQVELLKVEAQQGLRGLVTPIVLLVVAALVVLGCVPVLLLSLAYALVEFAELSQTLSLLISAGVGLLIAGVAAAIGRSGLRKAVGLQRSQEEFKRNVNWLKQILKQKSNPRSGECEPVQTNR